jgi:hypothetical protein
MLTTVARQPPRCEVARLRRGQRAGDRNRGRLILIAKFAW